MLLESLLLLSLKDLLQVPGVCYLLRDCCCSLKDHSETVVAVLGTVAAALLVDRDYTVGTYSVILLPGCLLFKKERRETCRVHGSGSGRHFSATQLHIPELLYIEGLKRSRSQ